MTITIVTELAQVVVLFGILYVLENIHNTLKRK